MVMCEKIALDAKSLLAQWDSNNYKKLCNYLKSHQWLKADILKLSKWVKENKIVKIAITENSIYGIGSHGALYITGRGNLGIADNFA